jgi:hypothetical protein
VGGVVILRFWRGEATGTIFYGGKDFKIVKTKFRMFRKSRLFRKFRPLPLSPPLLTKERGKQGVRCKSGALRT